jgi:hypothetical protein
MGITTMKHSYRLYLSAAVILACSFVLFSRIKFSFNPAIEGFFILEGENGSWLEITDDLVPEDASRLIWAAPLYPFSRMIDSSSACEDSSQPCLDFKWDKSLGRGFIRNTWPDGRKLIINLGRFKDTNGKFPSGLFIGGGLPPSDPDYQFMNHEATGMTYFDGRRWYHVWCNSNEGMISPASPFLPNYPSDWSFKGSWVRENDGRNLTIECHHRMFLSGVPIDIDRILFYTAGNSYVIISTELTNRGTVPVSFKYMYGDEPWIGDFGSSAGDVGWMEQELLLSERSVDTKKHSYFGMFDYGNELAGENHRFTGIANFIQWDRDERPDQAYISNFSGGITNPDKSVPLVSVTNRFIGLIYGPHILQPGKSFNFTLAVGMASIDPKTGFPQRPKTELNP